MSSSRCAGSWTAAGSSSARSPPSTTPNAPPPSPPSPPRRRAPAPQRLSYDELVLAPGSISRTLPVPGLAEHGIGFKTVEEAIGLRNHVIEQMDIASSTRDPAVRDAALTFVFVGGGYAGVEALAELEDMARYAARYYHNIRPEDMKWILVEASDRILPEVGEEMGRYAVTRAARPQHRRPAEHPAGVLRGPRRRPQRRRPLPDPYRRVDRRRQTPPGPRRHRPAAERPRAPEMHRPARRSRASRTPGRPETRPPSPTSPPAEPGKESAPNAQHALRQAKVLADNIAPPCAAGRLETYPHKYVGSVASLGLHKGVAHVYGRKLKGYPAWFMHRVYHLSRVPTFNRKARVLAEWTLAGLFKREIVSLGSLEHPRAEFELAAGGKPPNDPSNDPKGSS